MADDVTSLYSRMDLRLHKVRDGYLSGGVTLFGKYFEAEAFRVVEGEWNIPDNARPKRTVQLLEGLTIDDVPLQQIDIPGHPGKWLLFLYPGEDEHYAGPDL